MESKTKMIQAVQQSVNKAACVVKAKAKIGDEEGFLLPVENIFMVDHMRDQLEDKEKKLAKKDKQLAKKDKQLAKKDKQLAVEKTRRLEAEAEVLDLKNQPDKAQQKRKEAAKITKELEDLLQ